MNLNRVHYWHSNSSGHDGTGWGIREKGWGQTEAVMQEAADKGITKVINRGPEGDDGKYPLDFYVPDSVSPFLKAKPIRDHVDNVYDKLGFKSYIPYFGSLSHDISMRNAAESNDGPNWRWMFDETTRPWERCSTWSFDHIGAHGLPGTPSYYALRLEQSMGRIIYGEPHGEGIDENLLIDGNELDGCIVLDEHWRKAWKKVEFREKFKGHVIRIVKSNLDDARRILNESDHDVAITVKLMRQL